MDDSTYMTFWKRQQTIKTENKSVDAGGENGGEVLGNDGTVQTPNWWLPNSTPERVNFMHVSFFY